MKHIIIKIPGVIVIYNIIRKIILLPNFITDSFKFYFLSRKEDRFKISILETKANLLDRTKKTSFEPHYLYHPAWAARIIAKNKPVKHIDISSKLFFSAIISAFCKTEFYDYRPAKIKLNNLKSKKIDLNNLSFKDNSIESLSCMHTLEHIGLGRYGDKIDPNGDVKASKELPRVIKKGGTLIFVAPIGKPKICFNSHRIYSYNQVLNLFPDLKLKEFSIVPDNFVKHGLIRNAEPEIVEHQNWACGCFEFTK